MSIFYFHIDKLSGFFNKINIYHFLNLKLVVVWLCLSIRAFASECKIDIYPIVGVTDNNVLSVKLNELAKTTIPALDRTINKPDIENTVLKLPINNSLSRQYLSDLIVTKIVEEALTSNNISNCTITSPNRVLIRIKRNVTNEKRAEAIAKEYLFNLLNEKYRNVTLSVVGQINISYDSSVLLVPRHTSDELNKRMVVWVDAIKKHEKVISIPIWFNVVAYKEVFVLKKDVSKNQTVSINDYIKKDLNVASLSNKLFFGDASENNLRYRQDLHEGEILYEQFIKKQTAVSFGDSLEVISIVGGVKIQTMAIAQGDASIGEIVKVMPLDNKEIYLGRVAGPNLVIVDSNDYGQPKR